jgi:hypothetical protein
LRAGWWWWRRIMGVARGRPTPWWWRNHWHTTDQQPKRYPNCHGQRRQSRRKAHATMRSHERLLHDSCANPPTDSSTAIIHAKKRLPGPAILCEQCRAGRGDSTLARLPRRDGADRRLVRGHTRPPCRRRDHGVFQRPAADSRSGKTGNRDGGGDARDDASPYCAPVGGTVTTSASGSAFLGARRPWARSTSALT